MSPRRWASGRRKGGGEEEAEDDGAAPRGARLTKRASRPSPAYGSPSTDSASSVPGGMPKKMDLRPSPTWMSGIDDELDGPEKTVQDAQEVNELLSSTQRAFAARFAESADGADDDNGSDSDVSAGLNPGRARAQSLRSFARQRVGRGRGRIERNIVER